MRTRQVKSEHFIAVCTDLLKSGKSITLNVWGGSMEPWISSGDRVHLECCDAARARPGTVILFRSQRGALSLHRLRAVRKTEAGRMLFCQGHEGRDGEWVAEENALAQLTRLDRRSPLGQRLWDPARLIGSAEQSLATVARKYSTPEEVTYHIAETARGLTEDEQSLFATRTPGRLLIVGCGAGREAFALAQAGWQVTGIDVSAAAIAWAQQEARKREVRIDFRPTGITDFAAERFSLDCVFFGCGVYSYLPTRRLRLETLKKIYSWLRPGGQVLLSAHRLEKELLRVRITRWVRAWGQRASGRRCDAEPGDFLVQKVSGAPWTTEVCFRHFFRSEAEVRTEIQQAGGNLLAGKGNYWIAEPAYA